MAEMSAANGVRRRSSISTASVLAVYAALMASSSPLVRAGGRRLLLSAFASRQARGCCSPTQQKPYHAFGGIVPSYRHHTWLAFGNLNTASAHASMISRKRRLRGTSSTAEGSESETLPVAIDYFTNKSVSLALSHSIDLFRKYSIPEPDWSAVHLLSTALNLDWDGGYRHLLSVLEGQDASLSERIITSEEATMYTSMVQRRLKHEPLQYIIGQWDFCDLTLKVRAPCLCPRPETEELVDHAALEVEILLALGLGTAAAEGEVVRILDVGCGTGAIGIALAKRFGNKVDVTAIDVDDTAVKLSNENAQDILGPFGLADRYRAILCGASDFTNNISQGEEEGERDHAFAFNVVVSNPPYIPRADMATLSTDVIQYESDQALCGGDDGLDVVRDIVERLPEWSAADGCVCWMEVDTSQPSLVGKWLGSDVEFVEGNKDLCGRDRFVKLRVK